MIIDYNILALLTIIIGIIALFFVIDKYPMELISIGLLSSLAIIQVIFSKESTDDISHLLAGFANPGLVIMALLIMAEGMVATGAISAIADFLS